VYKNLHRFRFECSFYTWLYRIVTKRLPGPIAAAAGSARGSGARTACRAEYEEGTTDFFERQREHRPALDPEKHLVGQESPGPSFAAAMVRLSPRERIVFEMKHYQDSSCAPSGAAHWHQRRDRKEFALPRADAQIAQSTGRTAMSAAGPVRSSCGDCTAAGLLTPAMKLALRSA